MNRPAFRALALLAALSFMQIHAFAVELADVHYAFGFSGGLAAVMRDGLTGFCDTSGRIVFPIEYDEACDMRDGASIARKGGIFWLLKSDGTKKQITGFPEVVLDSYGEGLFIAGDGEGRYGFADESLRYVIAPEYSLAARFSEGAAPVAYGDSWRFIDKTGKELALLPDYSFVDSFEDGLARAIRGGVCVFLDKRFKEALSLSFDGASVFSEGAAMVSSNGKAGYIDKSGRQIVPLIYEDGGAFGGGLAPVSSGGLWGYINKEGKAVTGFIYEAAAPFENGRALVQENGAWKIISLPSGSSGAGFEASLSSASAWARDELREAERAGLIPEDLLSYYRLAVTRQDFCRIIMRLVEACGQAPVGSHGTGTAPFSDTLDSDVSSAAALGIVDGVGNGKFSPLGALTREQAAKMLAAAGRLLGLQENESAPSAFSDAGLFSEWARDGIEYVSGAGVMTGDSGRFNPRGTYSREQAYATALRLYRLLEPGAAE